MATKTDRFQIDQYDDGQIYIKNETGEQMLHAELNGPMNVTVQIGPEGVVEVDKLYGPLVFWSIRVRPDVETCEWVVERNMGPTGDEWREYARIPGQLGSDGGEYNVELVRR